MQQILGEIKKESIVTCKRVKGSYKGRQYVVYNEYRKEIKMTKQTVREDKEPKAHQAQLKLRTR